MQGKELMKKPMILYIITFVLSFLISNSVMYLIFKSQYAAYQEMQATRALEQASKVDSVVVGASSIIDIKLPDKIREEIEELPDPNVEFTSLMELKKRILAIYTEEEYESYTKPQVDSMLIILTAEIDTLAIHQNEYLKELNDLFFENKTLIDERDSLYMEIERLENQVQSITQNAIDKELKENQEADVQSVKYLAETYDRMSPNKVAQLMLALPDTKTIEILKMMNQRKAAKVLEVMPAGKSSVIVKKNAR